MSKAKSHIIFCDTSLSSRRSVYLNIYQNFLLVAMKTQRYLRSWGKKRVRRNTTFIYREQPQTFAQALLGFPGHAMRFSRP